MAKTSKTVYYCKQCGTESPKWVGRCPGCGEWNHQRITIHKRLLSLTQQKSNSKQ